MDWVKYFEFTKNYNKNSKKIMFNLLIKKINPSTKRDESSNRYPKRNCIMIRYEDLVEHTESRV